MTKDKNKRKIKYDFLNFCPQRLDEKNIDRLAVEKVPKGSLVLDIGCATGFLGEYLIKKGDCRVFGVDIRKVELGVAKKKLTGVILVDIEKEDSVDKILKAVENKKFDIILATSVIEHLKDQHIFLKNCKKLLKSKGLIVASTPNIAHWSIRLSLLKGNFDYSEYGILDNTHLRFFTIKTFRRLFEENNFSVKELALDSAGGGYPIVSKFLSKWFPEVFAYQILITAQPN